MTNSLAPDSSSGYTFFKWDITSETTTHPFPASIYVEGFSLDAGGRNEGTVTWELRDESNDPQLADTVLIWIEPAIWPTNEAAVAPATGWKDTATTNWDGFDVPAGWKIEKSLEQIILSSTVASEIDSNDTINDIGYIQTMFPDEGDEATSATTAGVFSTDDDFSDGFTMEFIYAFKDRVDASNSYVQAYGKDDKYSFVANSGIKFGTAVRPSDSQMKDYEIAILDVDSMVEVAGGSTGDIDFYDSGVNAGKTSNSGYAEEYLSTLMHGVRYGGDYSLMTADYETDGGNPDYDAILASQFDRYDEDEQEGTMIIDVTKNVLDLYDITVTVDNTVTYEGEDLDISSLTTIQIQSHWGSGVEFRNVIVTKS